MAGFFISDAPPLPQTVAVGERLIEIAILAGGLSTRMGRAKASLRLGRRTLLGHVRAAANATGWPVRVVRKDRVTRCGPLGGIVTALASTKAESVLFLACDMPLVTPELMRRTVRALTPGHRAVFSVSNQRPGFPFILRRDCLGTVEAQIAARQFSVHQLAAVLGARHLAVTGRQARQLFNINSPEDWNQARELTKNWPSTASRRKPRSHS